MKIYGYQNKAIFLLEHILSLLILVNFFFVITSSLRLYKNSSELIMVDMKKKKTYKILDRISEKVALSSSVSYSKNSIYLDDVVIKFNKTGIYTYKKGSYRSNKVLEYDDFKIKREDDLLIIKVTIKGSDTIKWISIR